MGWAISQEIGPQGTSKSIPEVDLAHLDDSDDSQHESSQSSGGMGTKVSTMTNSEPHDEFTSQFHDLVVNGEVIALKEYLEVHPTYDLDCRNSDASVVSSQSDWFIYL